jgi:hypothetical protein
MLEGPIQGPEDTAREKRRGEEMKIDPDRRVNEGHASLPDTPSSDGQEALLGATQRGEAASALPSDQRFEAQANKRGLFLHADERGGPAEQSVVDVQGGSHMH